MATKVPDETAMSYLNMARQYHDAANELFAISERRGVVGGHWPLSSPIYMLYHHTLELGFKAFLRASGERIEGTWRRLSHDLSRLYNECRERGLIVDENDRIGLENIANLLKSGNDHQGFRYFKSGVAHQPELRWTHEVVGRFMAVVPRVIEQRDPNAHDPPKPAKMIVTDRIS
jgi:hypothetical protein